MRLNKFIADAGICSRRKADEMIKEGRVTVNKQEAVIGMEITPEDVVRVDGERIRVNVVHEYYMLNKPKRVICSSEDKFGRKLAIDYIKSKKRLYTYGRLDYMTEGLIIISNDGDIYNHVMHPSKKLYKSYIAKLDKDITEDHLEALKHGVVIDGRRTAPAKVKIVSKREIRIAIFEGRNRQIRRMIEKFGYKVLMLRREKIGELFLGDLKEGKYRELTKEEIEYLYSV